MMLPLLFLPIASPVIIAAIESSAMALAGEPWSELAPWLGIIVAFDAIFLAISPFVFEFVIEE